MINFAAEILSSSALANQQFSPSAMSAGIIAGAGNYTPFQIYAGIIAGVVLTIAIYILDKLLPYSGPYVVYRHCAGVWGQDESHDHELILAVYERSTRGSAPIHAAEGIAPTLGRRCFTFLMHQDDIPIWLSEMNELLNSGKLKSYTEFGFDKKGLGLESPSNLGVSVYGQLTSKPTADRPTFSVPRT